MTVVDATVWVSAIIPQDIHHEASAAWLRDQAAEDATLIVPALALAEVAGAVARRTGAPELGRRAAEELKSVPGSRIVGLDVDIGTEAARIAASRQLRGADAVYVAVARALNVPLVTWDQEVQDRASGLVHAVHP